MSGINPGIWGSSDGEIPVDENRFRGQELTDERDINTARCEGTAFGSPPKTVFVDPSVELILGFLREPKVRGSDALQDVVIVFRGSENARRWVGNIPRRLTCQRNNHSMRSSCLPSRIDVKSTEEANEGMPHLHFCEHQRMEHLR